MFYYIFVNFAAPAGRRRAILTKEFLQKEFGEAHKEATGRENVEGGGYPDCGSGRYVMAAGYKNWVEFNTGQRIAANFLEFHMQTVTCLLIGGLHLPIVATALTVIYLLARMVYYYGYSKGPAFRATAVPVMVLISLVVSPILAIVSMALLFFNTLEEG